MVSCADINKATDSSNKGVEVFHERYNANAYSEIYSEADQMLRDVTSSVDFGNLVTKIHEKLSDVTGSKIVNWKADMMNGTFTIQLVTDTQFPHGNGSETFIFHIVDDVATLAGYRIDSSDLILN